MFLPGLRLAPTFLVDGEVAGTWKAEVKKGKAALTLEPFAKLSSRVKGELGDQGAALLRFLEPDATSHDVQLSRWR